ncbi:MAG: glycosyltransferase family 2 protein [Candidatus Omnitrophica bacterium]|nr:glycosyltransferase family 2 protein [Candidatus Omnitrophota bacterium]
MTASRTSIELAPLSVTIVTKNEEKRIRECIESVRWAEDILLIDDGSTDGTVPMAKLLGARVIAREGEKINEGKFRNWTLEKVRFDWVLKLDADERVTPELAEEIKQLLKMGPQYRGYAIPRQNYIGDYWVKFGGWYPARQLVLFNRQYFRWEEVEVHPRVFLDGPSGRLKHDIIHFSYRDFSHFFEKSNQQTTWEAQKWLKERRKIGPFLCARKMVDRFLKTYVLKQGFRDGFVGFAVAVFNGLYQFASYAKYWELLRREKKEEERRNSSDV